MRRLVSSRRWRQVLHVLEVVRVRVVRVRMSLTFMQ
jgi:hypothetical protein